MSIFEGEGAIVLRFSKAVKPHLSLLFNCFTAYEFGKVVSLQSTYSIRLYELCMQWRGKGKLYILVEDFRKRLGLEGKYLEFSELKKRVIVPAVEELQAKSGLTIDWKVERRGCKAVRLVIRFKERAISNLIRFPSEPSSAPETDAEVHTSTSHKG